MFSLHLPDVVVDDFGVPELPVSVDGSVEEVVVVVVLAVSLDVEQVAVGLLALFVGVVPGDLKLGGVEVDSLLEIGIVGVSTFTKLFFSRIFVALAPD